MDVNLELIGPKKGLASGSIEFIGYIMVVRSFVRLLPTLIAAGGICGAFLNPIEPIRIGEKQLFVDSRFMEKNTGSNLWSIGPG